jgi:hypothetical protein
MRDVAAAVAMLVAVFMGAGAACSMAIILKRYACHEWRAWRVRRVLREMQREMPPVSAGYVSERWIRTEAWKQEQL